MAPGGSGGPLGFDDDPEDEPPRARPTPDAERRDAPGSAPRLPAGSARYVGAAGVVAVLVIVLITLNTFRADAPDARRVTPGGAAPPFAAPLALSELAAAERNDVNVAVRADQGDAGNVPACSVRRPDVLNICTLYGRGPVVLAFFAARGRACVEQLDQLDDAARRHPEVAFAAVSIRGDLGDVRRTVRDRRWTFPVGYDDDGVLVDAYGVADCPQLTFLRRGGAVEGTSLGEITARDLDARVRRLER